MNDIRPLLLIETHGLSAKQSELLETTLLELKLSHLTLVKKMPGKARISKSPTSADKKISVPYMHIYCRDEKMFHDIITALQNKKLGAFCTHKETKGFAVT